MAFYSHLPFAKLAVGGALIAAAVLVLLNYGTLAGSHGLLDLLPVLLAVAAAAGAGAQWLHRRRTPGTGTLQSAGP